MTRCPGNLEDRPCLESLTWSVRFRAHLLGISTLGFFRLLSDNGSEGTPEGLRTYQIRYDSRVHRSMSFGDFPAHGLYVDVPRYPGQELKESLCLWCQCRSYTPPDTSLLVFFYPDRPLWVLPRDLLHYRHNKLFSFSLIGSFTSPSLFYPVCLPCRTRVWTFTLSSTNKILRRPPGTPT